jgi:hypothetical protein
VTTLVQIIFFSAGKKLPSLLRIVRLTGFGALFRIGARRSEFMSEKQKNKTLRVRLIFLVAAAISFGACSGEQVTQRKPATVYSADGATVRKVQLALRHRGYYTGAVDGFLGHDTSLGIEKYQVDQDQLVRPYIDRALLVSLGIAK